MTFTPYIPRTLQVALISVLLTGCCLAPTQQYRYSDEVAYLYPGGGGIDSTKGIVSANLPMRMGIAFVPDKSPRGPDAALLEQHKMRLMKEIKQQLGNDPLVSQVELVPSSYLSSGGGLQDLDRISSVFGVA